MLYYRKYMTHNIEQLKTLFYKYGGYLSRQQVDNAEINPQLLTKLTRLGRIERLQRGVYRWADAPMQNNEDFIELSLRIPYAVICLDSALAFHKLTTFIPKKIHLAVPQKAKPPKLSYPPLDFHYFSKTTFNYGIEIHKQSNQSFKVYSQEKTLVDLLRFKKKTLFTEGLKNYLEQQKKPKLTELIKAAKITRVDKTLIPLLEVLSYGNQY